MQFQLTSVTDRHLKNYLGFPCSISKIGFSMASISHRMDARTKKILRCNPTSFLWKWGSCPHRPRGVSRGQWAGLLRLFALHHPPSWSRNLNETNSIWQQIIRIWYESHSTKKNYLAYELCGGERLAGHPSKRPQQWSKEWQSFVLRRKPDDGDSWANGDHTNLAQKKRFYFPFFFPVGDVDQALNKQKFNINFSYNQLENTIKFP